MTITLAGVLPVSSFNAGLSGSVDGLQIELARLQADASRLGAAIAPQLEVATNFPPNVAAFTAAMQSQLNVADVTTQLANIVTASVDANADLVGELGVVNGQLTPLEVLIDPLELGLAASSIAAFTYTGPARGFGELLQAATVRGFGSFAPTEAASAVIVATEDNASWSAFSEGMDTGDSLQQSLSTARLRFRGTRDGAGWSIGTAPVVARLRLLLLELQALKAALEAQLEVSAGVNLPAPEVLAGVSVDFDVALDNLVNVRVDLDAEINVVQLKIDVVAALIADLQAQLSAGGFAVWTYSGASGQLGAEFAAEVAGGIPSGSGPLAGAFGMVLAGEPGAMTDFAAIFGP